MKKILFIIFLLFNVVLSLRAQSDGSSGWTQVLLIPDRDEGTAYILDARCDLPMPAKKLIKKISVKRDFIKKTKQVMLKECADSMRFYEGNFFKIIFYDDVTENLAAGQEFPDRMKGELYALDDDEMKEVRRQMKNDLYPEEAVRNTRKNKQNGEVSYDINVILQYGGESKIAFILPKINVLRKHNFKAIQPYYGFEVGPHLHFQGPYSSLSAIIGLEKSVFTVETSLSRFNFSAVNHGENGMTGPFRQTLSNLKLGVGIEGVRLKVGRSFVLSEYVPEGQKRIPLLNVGKFDSGIWSFELQFTAVSF
ncbi:MAG TPA: hypothetical protein VEC36_03225 [Patescibacteria group bacterium]|nr:hypothetical protein [Patescibacteria group bacterium]